MFQDALFCHLSASSSHYSKVCHLYSGWSRGATAQAQRPAQQLGTPAATLSQVARWAGMQFCRVWCCLLLPYVVPQLIASVIVFSLLVIDGIANFSSGCCCACSHDIWHVSVVVHRRLVSNVCSFLNTCTMSWWVTPHLPQDACTHCILTVHM